MRAKYTIDEQRDCDRESLWVMVDSATRNPDTGKYECTIGDVEVSVSVEDTLEIPCETEWLINSEYHGGSKKMLDSIFANRLKWDYSSDLLNLITSKSDNENE